MPKHPNHQSFATVVSALCLAVVLVSVTPVRSLPAAAAELITSEKIKDGTIKSKDLSDGVRQALEKKGPRGPKGPQGPQGPAGPSQVVTKTFPTKVVTNGQFPFAALDLPAGAWFVFVRANGANGGDVVTRLECVLKDLAHPAVELDFFKTGMAAQAGYPLQFQSLAMGGAVNLATASTVQATCGSQANTPVELIAARITAVRVGSYAAQP
jgi:hypothetical protein